MSHVSLTCLMSAVSQTERLSILFRAIEENKETLSVQDYSLSQTTLEEVFLMFAKQQQLSKSS